MNQSQEIKAKALELAISLTGARHTWMEIGNNGYVTMKEPLFTTFKTILAVLQADEPEELRASYRLVPGETLSP